jgi:hypothetical protein
MVMRMPSKEMMNMKTMMAMYARRHRMTQISAYDSLLDWIAVPSVDQAVYVQLLMQQSRRMNRSNMAWMTNFLLFPSSYR